MKLQQPTPISTSISEFRRRHEGAGTHPSIPPSDEEIQVQARKDLDETRLLEREQAWAKICPQRFADVSWDGLDQPDEILSTLDGWTQAARKGDAGNLLLFGPLGVGKTHAAIAVARRIFYAGKAVAFHPVVELLDDLRREGRDLPLTPFTRPGLLVLDDLGAEKPTEWTMERFYAILNRRWLDKLPTIGTCNFASPHDLRDALGARSYDRLLDGATALNFAGASRRHPK